MKSSFIVGIQKEENKEPCAPCDTQLPFKDVFLNILPSEVSCNPFDKNRFLIVLHVVGRCGMAVLAKSWLSSFAVVIIHVRHTAAGSKSENREPNEPRKDGTPPEKSGNACDYADQWAIALFMALSGSRYHHINTPILHSSPLLQHFPSFFHSITLIFCPILSDPPHTRARAKHFSSLQLVSVNDPIYT